jgi:hypothetical protein
MRRDYDDEDRLGRGRDPDVGSRSELMEAVDQLSRRLSGALMLAGGLIALGIYAGAGRGNEDAQTYQAFAADGEVFRVNTDSGTIIACNATRCMRVLERGQDLVEGQGNSLFKSAATPQLQAGPAQPSAPAQSVAPAGADPSPAAPALPAPQVQPAQPK